MLKIKPTNARFIHCWDIFTLDCKDKYFWNKVIEIFLKQLDFNLTVVKYRYLNLYWKTIKIITDLEFESDKIPFLRMIFVDYGKYKISFILNV